MSEGEVIEENTRAVEDYEVGNDGAITFLVGRVMEKTGGLANPQTANDLLREQLDQ
jgi:aspartyl-tRNA(Asn)/glutamyl-tRNA(Gln) amidotransferase subunit B